MKYDDGYEEHEAEPTLGPTVIDAKAEVLYENIAPMRHLTIDSWRELDKMITSYVPSDENVIPTTATEIPKELTHDEHP